MCKFSWVKQVTRNRFLRMWSLLDVQVQGQVDLRNNPLSNWEEARRSVHECLALMVNYTTRVIIRSRIKIRKYNCTVRRVVEIGSKKVRHRCSPFQKSKFPWDHAKWTHMDPMEACKKGKIRGKMVQILGKWLISRAEIQSELQHNIPRIAFNRAVFRQKKPRKGPIWDNKRTIIEKISKIPTHQTSSSTLIKKKLWLANNLPTYKTIPVSKETIKMSRQIKPIKIGQQRLEQREALIKLVSKILRQMSLTANKWTNLRSWWRRSRTK